MVRLIWTELESLELQEIYEFISHDSKNYAKRQVKRIRQRTNSLNLPNILEKWLLKLEFQLFVS